MFEYRAHRLAANWNTHIFQLKEIFFTLVFGCISFFIHQFLPWIRKYSSFFFLALSRYDIGMISLHREKKWKKMCSIYFVFNRKALNSLYSFNSFRYKRTLTFHIAENINFSVMKIGQIVLVLRSIFETQIRCIVCRT